MQKSTEQSKYLAVDVSKQELLVFFENKIRAIANTPAACETLLKAAGPQAHVVCEATGGYEQHLVDAAHRAGNLVSVVMPKRVRYYAYAAGLLAKNDPIDAKLIARYAEALKPTPLPKPECWQGQLRELMRRAPQPDPARLLHKAHCQGQTTQGRFGCRHAQTHRTDQSPLKIS